MKEGKTEGMTLAEAQRTVDHWITTTGVRYFGPLTNLGILTEEVGELARLIVREHGEQSFRQGTAPTDVPTAIGEEMADVLWVLAALANQCGVDLETAFRQSMEKKTARDTERHKANPKL